MLVVPFLLVLGMRRADAVREEGGTSTFTPGIMTGGWRGRGGGGDDGLQEDGVDIHFMWQSA
jgi:hypothetical protein